MYGIHFLHWGSSQGVTHNNNTGVRDPKLGKDGKPPLFKGITKPAEFLWEASHVKLITNSLLSNY